MTKKFRLPPDQIRPLIPAMGGCYASDRITVDGAPVGWMYRESPDNDTDSGWRFFAGDEDDAFASDHERFGFHDVNTICNYDPEIVPILNTEAPCAFERSSGGAFVAVDPPDASD